MLDLESVTNWGELLIDNPPGERDCFRVMTFTCPMCTRTIYNRRRVTCEFCGSTIPSELLFNPAQVAAIERLKKLEEQEHRVFMQKPMWSGGSPSNGGSYF